MIVGLDHRGHQAMVQPGGRRLNPPQPARRRTTPSQSTGTLAWPQKMSAAQDLVGDALLPGVDHFGRGRRGGDLLEVPRLDGIAKDDSHGRGLRHAAKQGRSCSTGHATIVTFAACVRELQLDRTAGPPACKLPPGTGRPARLLAELAALGEASWPTCGS